MKQDEDGAGRHKGTARDGSRQGYDTVKIGGMKGCRDEEESRTQRPRETRCSKTGNGKERERQDEDLIRPLAVGSNMMGAVGI